MSCGCNTSGPPYVDLSDQHGRACRVAVRAIHRVEQRDDGRANLWWSPDDVPFRTRTLYADAIAAIDAALAPRRSDPGVVHRVIADHLAHRAAREQSVRPAALGTVPDPQPNGGPPTP